MDRNEAPEKIYLSENPITEEPDDKWLSKRSDENDIEYTRTDAFIEKALKWYCRDCECNNNCSANHSCFFRDTYKMYLEGNDKALPPKISNAFNPDGSTTENYRYRHLISKLQSDFIEKVCEYLYSYNQKQVQKHGAKATIGCGEYTINVEDFRNYMKGEEL